MPSHSQIPITANAAKVLERRYLLRDDHGRVVETPAEMFRRVARAIASAESRYGGDAPAWEERFYAAMASLEFLPNSPTLMNAGTPIGQLSACFVIPVLDSMVSIFEAVKNMAVIHQSGGGTGFDFSRLRPNGDIVGATHGTASGPVSFMRVFDTATDVIKQGGRRRGANMGILRIDHPDIEAFISAKTGSAALSNFNISVAVTDAFMDALARGGDYALVSPRTGKEVKRLSARLVFDRIAESAWAGGDPGLVFIDEVNRANPTPALGDMTSTNPCGELPLLPYESCNLGSINVAKFARDGALDWPRLGETVHLAVRFLDDVIDANRYPLPQTADITRANRKIGLGVMGFADALAALGLPYDSEEGIAFGERLMGFIQEHAWETSRALARERGAFPNFERSLRDRPGAAKVRNATVTSIAPTGTISIIAGCSSGIEPLFAITYIRSVMDGTQLLETNAEFERLAKRRGFHSPALMEKIAKSGGVRGLAEVPQDVRRIFATDFDIAPEWHVRMQAAFQRHCDNAVSKTINLPQNATVDDVAKAFRLAYALKCKGITVFRYGSKGEQVLYRGSDGGIHASPEYAGGCPDPAVCNF